MKMKNIVFYSSDFNMCFSLLIYLQNNYNVTTTTDIEVVKTLIDNSDFNLLILDSEPSDKIETLCRNVKDNKSGLPIILTYVFKNQIKDFDSKIRKYVNSIFYKPFDLNEVSRKLSMLL
jgi:DNA-binding NtrC family response regulator